MYFIHSLIFIVNMYSALGPAVGIVILLADKMFHCFKCIHFYLHETPNLPTENQM